MNPVVTYSKGWWTLKEDYHYSNEVDDISIQAGFKTDLASIPRFLWPIIAPFELSLAAPLVHDYLYHRRGWCQHKKYNRKQVDKLFARIMKEEGVWWWRRVAAYRAVRLFGHIPWGSE